MKAVTGLAKLGTVLGMAAVLSACGGAPSESDVRKAFEASMAEQKALLSDMGGVGADLEKMLENMMPKIEILSVKDCKEADAAAYTCNVEAKVSVGENTTTNTEKLTLRKNDSGDWTVVMR